MGVPQNLDDYSKSAGYLDDEIMSLLFRIMLTATSGLWWPWSQKIVLNPFRLLENIFQILHMPPQEFSILHSGPS